jgi:hypothetical protein
MRGRVLFGGRVLFVLAGLLALSIPASAQAAHCRSSNIDGDHITSANAFEVSGLSCFNAFESATGLVDSPASIQVTVPGTERFTAEFFEWRYQWTCRSTELPARLQRPIDGVTYSGQFRCHAVAELAGRRRGTVHMSFRWFLPFYKSCPNFQLEYQSWEAVHVTASRNVPCGAVAGFIEESLLGLERKEPFKVEYLPIVEPGESPTPIYYYRYFNGGQYECLTSPLALGTDGPKSFTCQPVEHRWGSREFHMFEKPR